MIMIWTSLESYTHMRVKLFPGKGKCTTHKDGYIAMFLITGVTGKTGSEIARQLLAANAPVRVMARTEEKGAAMKQLGAEVAVADFDDIASLDRALSGVEKALLVTPNGEHQLDRENAFTDACVRNGVKHIVNMSSMESVEGTTNPFTSMHVASEKHIRESGLDWTILKPSFFSQNFSNMAAVIKEKNMIALPIKGTASVAPTDVRDVAEVAVKVFTEAEHAGQVYVMTCAELTTFAGVAETFSEVLGREIKYVEMPEEAFRERLKAGGYSQWRIDGVCQEFHSISDGIIDHTTDTVQQLLGRPPTSLTQFINDHRSLFE